MRLVRDVRAARDIEAQTRPPVPLSEMVSCLIVEDNEADALLTLEAVASVGGVEATLAVCGDEALRLLQESKNHFRPEFDIAFVDLRLAGSRTQGTDLITQLRTSFPKTHIIVVTGALGQEATEFLASEQQKGAYIGLVTKPLVRENLCEILDKHRMRK